MADTKISALTDVVTLAGGDEFAINDVSAAASKKATLDEVATFIQAARFWVIWTANSTTILDSFNMTSIADTGVGDADGTIATDFSSANWAGSVTTLDATDGWDNEQCSGNGFNAKAAGTFGVLNTVITDGGTAVASLTDPEQWCVLGFGDQ